MGWLHAGEAPCQLTCNTWRFWGDLTAYAGAYPCVSCEPVSKHSKGLSICELRNFCCPTVAESFWLNVFRRRLPCALNLPLTTLLFLLTLQTQFSADVLADVQQNTCLGHSSTRLLPCPVWLRRVGLAHWDPTVARGK